jgi:hypothetical protein
MKKIVPTETDLKSYRNIYIEVNSVIIVIVMIRLP